MAFYKVIYFLMKTIAIIMSGTELWLKTLSHYVSHANCRLYFEGNRTINCVP